MPLGVGPGASPGELARARAAYEGYNPELVEGHSPLYISLLCRHFVFF